MWLIATLGTIVLSTTRLDAYCGKWRYSGFKMIISNDLEDAAEKAVAVAEIYSQATKVSIEWSGWNERGMYFFFFYQEHAPGSVNASEFPCTNIVEHMLYLVFFSVSAPAEWVLWMILWWSQGCVRCFLYSHLFLHPLSVRVFVW